MPIKGGFFLKKHCFAILFLHVDFLPQHKDKRTLEFIFSSLCKSPNKSKRGASCPALLQETTNQQQDKDQFLTPAWKSPSNGPEQPRSVFPSVRIPFPAGISGLAFLGTAQLQVAPLGVSPGFIKPELRLCKALWAELLQGRVGSVPPTAATT